MKRLRIFILVTVISLLGAGCSHPVSIPAVEIDRISGEYKENMHETVALIVSMDSQVFDKTLKPSTYAGSALDFPISASPAFFTSIKTATEKIFKYVVDKDTCPTVGEMRTENISGYIFVEAKHYEPRISFVDKLLFATVTSSARLGFQVTIKDKDNNTLLYMPINSEYTEVIDASDASGWKYAVMSATKEALKKSIEHYIEEIQNSEKVHKYFSES